MKASKFFDLLLDCLLIVSIILRFWWTLTGNYGSLPPIDFHQSVIRRNQMAALDLKVPKVFCFIVYSEINF